EHAGQLFSVVAAWRPSKRAKPAAWDPPPRFRIRAYSGRFQRSVLRLTTLPRRRVPRILLTAFFGRVHDSPWFSFIGLGLRLSLARAAVGRFSPHIPLLR